jgi:rhodanese-related sulfurtransferase
MPRFDPTRHLFSSTPSIMPPSTTTPPIHPETPMGEILQAYPSARRALFMRYHVGGCSSCGYDPSDTLADVCKSHNILDVDEVIRHIHASHEADQRLQVDVRETQRLMQAGEGWRLIDVREDFEREIVAIEGAEAISQELVQSLMGGPKDAKLIFFCHHGMRSLDAASYFVGHGFEHVRSMSGGIEAWAQEIDPTLARY